MMMAERIVIAEDSIIDFMKNMVKAFNNGYTVLIEPIKNPTIKNFYCVLQKPDQAEQDQYKTYKASQFIEQQERIKELESKIESQRETKDEYIDKLNHRN